MTGRRADDLAEEFEIDQTGGADETGGADQTGEADETGGADQTGEADQTGGPAPGEDPATAQPDYNVAPTKLAPVVLERRPRTEGRTADPQDPSVADAVRWLRLFRWGLVPSWAKDPSVGNRMINARAETLLERPAYKRAALSRRCLVPADGWYEWQKSPTETDAKGQPRKQPFFMHPLAGRPIAMAGVFELWRNPAVPPDDPVTWLATYAVITTAAEPGLDVIHDRMPLVLPRDRWDAWLDPGLRDPDAVRALLQPPVTGRFLATAVTTRVNTVSNNGPQLLEPVPADQLRGVVDPATGKLVGGGDGALF